MGKRILCPLLVIFVIGGISACGSDSLQIKTGAVLEGTTENVQKEKPQKDGFDEKTNIENLVGEYVFSIPEYYEVDTIDTDHYRAYAEIDGKTAYIEILETEDEEIPATYEVLCQKIEDGEMEETFKSWFDSTKDITTMPFENEVIKGFILSSQYIADDVSGYAQCMIFPSMDENKWFFIILNQTDGTEYSYTDDFKRILNNIEQIEKKDPWDLTGSWWEESVANGDPGMAAYISDSEINIYNVTDNDYIRTPFWIGSYENQVGEDSFSWTSQSKYYNNNDQFPRMSNNETKDFQYSDGVITFITTQDGKDVTRTLLRADYDFSEDYRKVPDNLEEASVAQFGDYAYVMPAFFGFNQDSENEEFSLRQYLSGEAELRLGIPKKDTRISELSDSDFDVFLSGVLNGLNGMADSTVIEEEQSVNTSIGVGKRKVVEGTYPLQNFKGYCYIGIVGVKELNDYVGVAMYTPAMTEHDYSADFDYLLEHITVNDESKKTVALSRLNSQEDKVTQNTYYTPKVYPENINTRTFVLPYIGVKDGKAVLHLKANYYNGDWVMWRSLIFAVDDNPRYQMDIPTFDTSTTNIDGRGNVVENYDFKPLDDEDINMLWQVINSEEAIIRFHGDGRNYDLTVSEEDKQGIKDVLIAYDVLK